MQIQRIKFLAFILILVVTFAASPRGMAAQETAPPSSSPADQPVPGSSMTISDLVSSATKLSGRLSTLERNLELAYDSAGFGKHVAEIEEQLKGLTVRLSEMKADGRLGYERLSSLKAEMVASAGGLEKTWKPFADRIQQVEGWSQEWSQDYERVQTLESSLPRDESYKTIRPTIDRAKETIAKARKLLSANLNTLFAVQDKAAGVQVTADSLVAEVDGLLKTLRGDLFQRSAPAMFSSTYFHEFNTVLGEDLKKGFQFLSVLQWKILQRNAPFLVLQVALWLIIAILIIRNRAALETEPRLLFITERPFSAGVLFGFLLLLPFYEASIGVWGTVFLSALAICIARLSGCCVFDPWSRRGVYGLLLALILNEFLQLSDFPQPLFRMYVLFVSLTGLFFCLWRVMNLGSGTERRLHRWALWGGVVLSGTTLAANVSGFSALAAHLLEASLRTVLLVLLGWILTTSGRGGIEWLFKSALATRVPLLQKNAAVIVHLSSRVLNLFVGAFIAIRILVTWGLYDDGVTAFRSVMSVGFTIGSWHANLGHVLAAFLALYGAHLASKALQSILVEEIFPRRRVERGVRVSINSLLHYAILLVGFLVALAILGVNFTNITIIGGALGVGIGFGLQTIVNNFVSGLILLFERPIRVGDYIEIGGLWAEVKKIGLRATIVQSFDRADVVIPNSQLISNQLTNWTRSNRMIRLRLPVGVAYGSDVPLVMKILLESAKESPSVLSDPEPQVIFMGFGESSLNFDLRAFVLDIDHRLIVQTEILQEIDRQFREAGITIPFPQRDLHLRSVDEKAGKGLLGNDL